MQDHTSHIDNLIERTNIAQTKKAEDPGFGNNQTIYQGDTSLYFGVSINEQNEPKG
jgi:hypothetical protein